MKYIYKLSLVFWGASGEMSPTLTREYFMYVCLVVYCIQILLYTCETQETLRQRASDLLMMSEDGSSYNTDFPRNPLCIFISDFR